PTTPRVSARSLMSSPFRRCRDRCGRAGVLAHLSAMDAYGRIREQAEVHQGGNVKTEGRLDKGSHRGCTENADLRWHTTSRAKAAPVGTRGSGRSSRACSSGSRSQTVPHDET